MLDIIVPYSSMVPVMEIQRDQSRSEERRAMPRGEEQMEEKRGKQWLYLIN